MIFLLTVISGLHAVDPTLHCEMFHMFVKQRNVMLHLM